MREEETALTEQTERKEEYKELRPANAYDVAANETWLEDMAREGYRLVGMTAWRGVFEKTEPFTCRYRMQPLPKKEAAPPPEVTEAYRDLGWEYAGTIRGAFHVWRCEDPAAPELDTDPVVQGMGYRYLKGKMLRDGVWSVFLLAVLAALYVLLPTVTSTPLLDSLETIPGRVLSGAVGSILLAALAVSEVYSIGRLLRSLNAGIPLDRPRPYRRQKWLARGLVLCLGYVWIAGFLGGGRTIDGGSLSRGWDAGDSHFVPKAGVVYVDLAGLEGAEDTEFFECRTKIHALCPRMYFTRQLSLDSVEEEPQPGGSYPVRSSVETTYYRMLTEGLAGRLTEELIQRRIASFGVDGHPELAAVQTEGLDGFWWGEDRYYQFAVARLGRQVLFIQYEGDSDLRQAGAYFAALLV